MKEETEVLVIPAAHGPRPASGVWSLAVEAADGGSPWSETDDFLWLPRSRVEQDERFLQIIPYALLTAPDGDVWCYQRLVGDARLRERFSCGVGGHIERIDEGPDFAATVRRALQREFREELGHELPQDAAIAPHAWIFEGLTAIGRVHLGLVFLIPWCQAGDPQPLEPDCMTSLGFWPRERVVMDERFELWSRLALGDVPEIAP